MAEQFTALSGVAVKVSVAGVHCSRGNLKPNRSIMTDYRLTAYVVRGSNACKQLNNDLSEAHKAFQIGDGRMGFKFNRIVMLARLHGPEETEWFEHFKCCLAPDGEVI